MGNPALVIYPNKCTDQRSFYLLINTELVSYLPALLQSRSAPRLQFLVGSGCVASSQACQALKKPLGFCRKYQAYVEDRGIVKYQLFNEWMASNLPPLLVKKVRIWRSYSKHNTRTAELVLSSTDKTG